jgi:hypothetical protein
MTKRKHQFAGEYEAGMICDWLNSGQSAGRKRIVEVMALFDELGTAPFPWHDLATKKQSRSVEIWQRLQDLIDRHSYKFKLTGERTVLVPAGKDGDAWHEAHSMQLVHRLRQLNLLSRVLCCAGCNRWMFSKLPGNRFHSVACRVKTNQSTQEWKDRNNEKRREKYEQKNQGGTL